MQYFPYAMCSESKNVCFLLKCLLLLYLLYNALVITILFLYYVFGKKKVYALTFIYLDKHEQKSDLKIYAPNLTNFANEDASDMIFYSFLLT